MANGELQERQLRDFAEAHVALLASATVVLFALLRVYWVAGSISNASELITAFGPVDVVTKSLLMLVPSVPALVLIYLFTLNGLVRAWPLTAGVAFVALAVTPKVVLIIVAVNLAIVIYGKGKRGEGWKGRSDLHFSDLVPTLLFTIVLSFSVVWMPTEKVVSRTARLSLDTSSSRTRAAS